MGYQTCVRRSPAGRGVVRCSCSHEEVKILFRSGGGGGRRLTLVFVRRWLESPRLSSVSIGSNERAPSATPSESSDRRPLSLVSTLSSGSWSSREDPIPPPDPVPSPEGEGPDRKGRSLSLEHNNNNNNTDASETAATWGKNRALSRRQQPAVAMAPSAQLTYLDRVVMEIIETERMYVRDLRMIVEDYLAHIIDQSDVNIRPEQVCSLFGNIEDIYEFNSELLQALDLCDNDPVAVARCFVLKSEYFEIYTQYCTNYPNSVAALTDCMRNKSLAKFFRERQESLKRSLPLGSYLLKPVQRILKYHLLLQEIAKHFDPQQEGYDVVEEAIITMTTVAWYINDMKRKHEHAVRLQEVQSLLLNWKGADLTTYGELVLEGNFKLHRAKNERTLFLFQRMLLITKRRGEHYVYKTHISCSTLMLIESAKDSLSFSVTHYKQPKQPHTVQAKTVEEKKLWAHHIKRIILENHHALIPQKAKDAILEMDSIYPPRHRYSPERLKKAPSSQADEFPRRYQGRREPTNEILKSTKDVSKETDGGSNGCKKENGRLPEEEEASPEAACKQSCEDVRPPETTSESEPTEEEEPEPSSNPDGLSAPPPRVSASPPRSDRLRPDGGPQPASGATTDSDSKTLSSGESSEDEGYLKGAPETACGSPSILPSSVLDKASAIAQHFAGSVKHGVLATDDIRSPSCESPRLPRSGGGEGVLILGAEPRETRLNSNSECDSAFGATGVAPMSPRSVFAQRFAGSVRRGVLAQDDVRCESPRLPRSGGSGEGVLILGSRLNSNSDSDSAFGATDAAPMSPRGLRRRRDSTLSPRDQLLIGKIKMYYENAESEDATFSVQRRESLTYIPTGLVRSSVSRINSVPSDDPGPANPAPSAPCYSLVTRGHGVSGGAGPGDVEGLPWSRSRRLQDDPPEDEEFRPSSEMIGIWQTMEAEITGRVPRDVATETAGEGGEGGASELASITEESSNPAPGKIKASGTSRTRSRRQDDGDRTPSPRVSQNQNYEAEESNRRLEADKTKSKVLHLARQYSQRIRTCEPAVGQRSPRLLMDRKTLPCVLEEKESTGKPRLTLPLVPENPPLSAAPPVDQVAPGLAAPPLVSSPIEGFSWPDVRELRSKYSAHGRSLSVSEQTSGAVLRRRSSCTAGASGDVSSSSSSSKPRSNRGAGREERRKRLHRAHSLDPRLSRAQITELHALQEQVATGNHDGYYVAAEAPLPDDPEHKIIVMERRPEPESKPADAAAEEEDGDNYVQIRSPTSREKISIRAVIDRCRLYRDSDEYRHRDDVRATAEPGAETGAAATLPGDHGNQTKKTGSGAGPNTDGGHGVVKSLREKFQSRS